MYGSFLGFTYNDIHSSSLGIIRTINSLLSLELQPTFQDLLVEVPGSEGHLYFGSKGAKVSIPIDFAFDSLTEQQLTELKKVFNSSEPKKLILDENPYKAYLAKISEPPKLQYVVFEERGNRVYKGTGTFNFVSYGLYAVGLFKFLEDFLEEQQDYIWYFTTQLLGNEADEFWGKREELQNMFVDAYLHEVESNFTIVDNFEDEFDKGEEKTIYNTFYSIIASNLTEWKSASRLPSRKDYGLITNYQVKLYNAGDAEMPLELWYSISQIGKQGLTIEYNNSVISLDKPRHFYPEDVYLVFNTRDQLVYGYSKDKKRTGSIYNQYLTKGEFFLVDTGEQIITFKHTEPVRLEYSYLFW